jgi:hypothetical protein
MVSHNVQPPTRPQGRLLSTHIPPTISSDTHNTLAYCVTVYMEHKTTAVVFQTHRFQTVRYLELGFMIEISMKKTIKEINMKSY